MKTNHTKVRSSTGLEVAVIGMAGRFPGAENIDQLWSNLLNEVESISQLTDDELLEMGITKEVFTDKNYVKARGIFPNLEYFDSDFFHYTPGDARIMDPQVRAMHEEVYHALEDAGYSSDNREEAIGLFLGATNNFAWEASSLKRTLDENNPSSSATQLNDKDFIATRIAYSLNLKGPAVTMHCACSTSLVAIDLAYRNILTGSCQIAVAGGSGLTLPYKSGYMYQEGMIYSEDGKCKAFDKNANGTVEGNGAAAVVLKSLKKAIKDGDNIYAVIKGSAVNNDGNRKVGFTAPSIEGQADVIKKAMRMADVSPETISYVETHGTGTKLGDPIEVEALAKVFRSKKDSKKSCGIGSLKTSIGHMDVASGVASFVKTVNVLNKRIIPRSLNYKELNPNINIENSMLYVVDKKVKLENNGNSPLRAGVSAFGIGGTNAHVVLEEAPERQNSSEARKYNLFCVTANSEEAMKKIAKNYLEFLKNRPEINPTDLAWTQQNRQRNLKCRYSFIYRDIEELQQKLDEFIQKNSKLTVAKNKDKKDVYFLFSGQGSQYRKVGVELYQTEKAFRNEMDDCFAILDSMGRRDIKEIFEGNVEDVDNLINRTEITQILLFIIEYSMAKLLISWGIEPKGMIGHSIGELTAACVSGVFTLEEGIKLVSMRGKIMEKAPVGAMLAITTDEECLEKLLDDRYSIAAVNSQSKYTISGAVTDIDELETLCKKKEIPATRLNVNHAFHSKYMNQVLDEFKEFCKQIEFKKMSIPYISNLSGDWITAEESTSEEYYCNHIRCGVQFKQGIETILRNGNAVCIEVGPGKSLSSFVREIGREKEVVAVNMFRHRLDEIEDSLHIQNALKKLWDNGVKINWKAYYENEIRNKVSLPLYPFDKKKFSVDVREFQKMYYPEAEVSKQTSRKIETVYTEAGEKKKEYLQMRWIESLLPFADKKEMKKVVLIFTDSVCSMRATMELISHWTKIYISYGEQYSFNGIQGAVIRPNKEDDIQQLFIDLKKESLIGETILYNNENPDNMYDEITYISDMVSSDVQIEAAVKDIIVMGTSTYCSRIDEITFNSISMNYRYSGFTIKVIACDESIHNNIGRDQWSRYLLQELESEESRDVAIHYKKNKRYVPMMVPVQNIKDVEEKAKEHEDVVMICSTNQVQHISKHINAVASQRNIHIQSYESRNSNPQKEIINYLDKLSHCKMVLVWHAPNDRTDLYSSIYEYCQERQIYSCFISTFYENMELDNKKVGYRIYSSNVEDIAEINFQKIVQQMYHSKINTLYFNCNILEKCMDGKCDSVEKKNPDGGMSNAQITITNVLKKILGYDEIDADADIFDLGLDSVKMLQFTSELEKQGYKLLANQIYSNPTISALTELADYNRINSKESKNLFYYIENKLNKELDIECSLHKIEHFVVMFVEDLNETKKKQIVKYLAKLNLDSSSLPHYIVQKSLEKRVLKNNSLENIQTFKNNDSSETNKIVEGYLLDIDKMQDALKRSISSQPISYRYNISPIQKRHFQGKVRLQLYLIQFEEILDVKMLEKAFCDVVASHGLMRSFLYRFLGKFKWKEYKPSRNLTLPQIDISNYGIKEQEHIMSQIAKEEWSMDFKRVDTPMYRVVLVKYNERKYDLLFQFDHSIFDATSGQIFRTDLINRYHELLKGTVKAMPTSKSYRDLLNQIYKGPVDITQDEIIEKFELREYVKCANKINEIIKDLPKNRVEQLKYSIDLAQFGPNVDAYTMFIYLYAKIVSKILNTDKVAFDILDKNRTYEDKDYIDVMGMVLSGIPIYLDMSDSRQEISNKIYKRLELINKKNVSLLNLVHDLPSALKYLKIINVVKSINKKSFYTPFLLNYVGNVENEYDKIWEMTLEQLDDENQEKLDYGECYFISKCKNNKLEILILCKCLEDINDLKTMLDEEVELLLKEERANQLN